MSEALSELIPEGIITYESAKPALECFDINLIEDFEDFVNEKGQNQTEELNDYGMSYEIVNGMCRRTLKIPANIFITGRIHKSPYVDMIIYGDVSVQVPNGVERYKGFNMLEGIAGRKRVLYTHEETLWVTVDRTSADNIEDAEDDVTFGKSFEYEKYLLGGE